MQGHEENWRAPVTVRRAGHRDAAGWVTCAAALFAEDAGTRDALVDPTWPRTHGAARFAEQLGDTSRLLLVAAAEDGGRGGEVVGHLSGVLAGPSAIRPHRSAELTAMWVRPDQRGAGVGGRLVAEFRAWAREAGAVAVEVSAYAANAGALRFYERHGFAPQTVTLRAVEAPPAAGDGAA